MDSQILNDRPASHDAAVLNPEILLPSRPSLTEGERQRVLIAWNDTQRRYPRDRCVHQLFEEQVQRTPHAQALWCGDRSLTYAELNNKANRLGHYLRSQGVGPEVLVGLLAERSPEMVIGLLGALKSGGAYLPLDPDYPAERLALLLAGARPAIVLAQSHLLAQFPVRDTRVVCLDRDWALVADEADANRECGVGPDNLAYVIYTSGSTGTPKGVMNTHAGICNRLHWMQEAYPLDGTDRVLQRTPFSFDVSVWEFLWPLLAGASLVLARPGGHREPSYLARMIEDCGITVIHFVPSMLQVFLEEPNLKHRCRTLRHLFASGEALPESVARRCLERLPCRLHNLYGPTEAAIDVTYWECRCDDPGGPVPIGKPIANTRVYILDEQMEPLPLGVAGELYVGGVGVARGYLNRPELTAERFVPDPFDRRAGARLYRTGDVARWRPDGNIEFLGRLDSQVKLRGFRIELGEIETALCRHSAIRQAAVLLREDRPGDKRLVAYIVAGGDRIAPEHSELRAFLAKCLPEYMVPSVFVTLPSFPFNANGKLDRKALPPPGAKRLGGEAGYAPPRDEMQKVLVSIWEEALGVSQVGIQDDFFELGGHSLKAAAVTTRVSDLVGIALPVGTLFDCRTVAGLAERIRRLRENGEEPAPEPPLPITRQANGPTPLSFAQARLWFLDQLEGSMAAYNIPTATCLRGKLDVEALRRALEGIVARHEPLRTTFYMEDGWPFQRVNPPARFELSVEDLRDVAVVLREKLVDECIRQQGDRPFDLEHDVALRASLLRVADAEHLLLVTMHHIASDDWSMAIFWRELARLYNASLRGEEGALPELPICYADYSIWRRNMLAGGRWKPLVAYWQRKLDGLAAFELPTDRPRPAILSYRGATHEFVLSARLVRRLRELGSKARATLNMVLLAGFQLLLSRYSGLEDIAVGVPAAGRGRPEVEGLIGFFVNTLVIRVDVSGAPSFEELLDRVREASLEAYQNGELPFDQIVEQLHPERRRDRNPLVQVVFQSAEAEPAAPTLAGLEVRPHPVPSRHVRFDLELALRADGEGLRGEIAYMTDLFDEPTIERLSGHFETLLEGLAAEPQRRVHELPILSAPEHHRFLIEANDTAVAYPHDRCIHQLFEEQAARSPQAVAIVCGDRSLTYSQLNGRANQLARLLRAMGVAAESRVAIRLRRSPEMIVALLGILKAGGAYVPLNPGDPEARLRLIVKDSGATTLLTERPLAESCPDLGAATLLVDEECPAWNCAADTNLEPVAPATSLAYVIYTSGTTGEPKGVLIENRSVVRLVCGAHYATFGPDRVFLHLAPLAFDASTFEIWGALLHGARVVLAPSGLPDFAELGRLIQGQGVTTLWLTAGLFNEIVESRLMTLAGVQEILTGGEALSPKHVRMAYEGLPRPLRIINGYGPTECTTFACCHAIDPARLDAANCIPIGKPISNTRVYVLDAHGQPVPTGVAGELHLGGDGLARGYLNRPAATAERFVPDPFEGCSEARLYRTGDLVRWRPDGNIEFLGRLDNQVKLRGFRIELGEIEAALCRHPAIQQAVVLLREVRPGDKRLVAYLVAGGDRVAPEDGELRLFVAKSLPEYMVPSAFVSLASLPLNANGKLDRKALPSPEAARLGGESRYMAPRDDAERALASIWEAVLGVAPVGVRDGFFQLGGHSLLAVRLVAKIEDTLNVRLPLSTVLKVDTIEAMAKVVKESRQLVETQDVVAGRKPHNRVVTLQPHGDRPPVFMLPGGISHVMSFRHLALAIGNEWPLYGLQPNDQDLSILPYPTFEELASDLVDDITRVAGSGPYYLLGFSAGGQIAYEIAQHLSKSGGEVKLLGLLDTYAPGYPRLLPFPTRLMRHLRKLRHLDRAEARRYAIDHTQALFRRLQQPFLSSRQRMDRGPAKPSPVNGSHGYSWNDVLDRHRPSIYQGRVDVFTANSPNWIGSDFGDLTLGWGPLVKGELRLHRIDGDHLEIITPPFVNVLAAEIRDCLG